ncbi:MAG: hypothetical protein M1497_12620 [Nitrospirae bacterium]|nr:hypothetical protein [Nitrospirota bacterium]
MGIKVVRFFIVLALPFLLAVSVEADVSMWERMCGACHDGTTVLNGKVVVDKEQIKAKYKTLDDLVKAVSCEGAPCMNILKHDEKLVRQVGKELGIKDTAKK